MTPTKPIVASCICGDPRCTTPFGLCHCGCGDPTPPAKRTNEKERTVKEIPTRYLRGHQTRRWDGLVQETGRFKIDGIPCRLIPLTHRQYAIVWESDYDWLCAKGKWNAKFNKKSGKYYAARSERIGTKKHLVYMHRLILGLAFGDPRQADHVEPMVGTDNRRSNLRIATDLQNRLNKRKMRTNTTGYKGVILHKPRNLFKAVVAIGGRVVHCTYHKTAHEAYLARQEAVRQWHGEFGRSE